MLSGNTKSSRLSSPLSWPSQTWQYPPVVPLDKPVSKAQRRPAEYDRFGGIGISMAGPSNPQQGYVT
jgi:hypothetical protein